MLGTTLYNHQDLWHPDFMRLALDFEPVEIPQTPLFFSRRVGMMALWAHLFHPLVQAY